MTERSSASSILLATGGLITLATAMGIGRFVYTPILPFMQEALDLTPPQAGLIASANFLGYLLGALAASKSHLPGDRRLWFLSALGVSAATTAAMGLVDEMAPFLLLRFVSGVASAFALIFSAAYILEALTQAGRGKLSALFFAGVGVGIVVSSLLVSALAAFGGSWSSLWLASGLLSFVALIAVIRLVPARKTVQAAAPPVRREGKRDTRLIALIIAYGLFGFGYVITATFISTMVRSDPLLQPIEPYVWLTVGVAAAPSVAFWGWMGRRIGNDRSFVVACLVQAFGVALSVLSTDLVAVLLAAALLGGTFMGLTALGLMHARSLSQGDPRRSLGLMTAAFGLGQVIGPGFAGYTHDLTGSFTAPSLVAAGLLVVAAGLGLKARA
ncbi:YbfB/YjiJ family MFS transporter [Limibacillus sp. MBR-115]|jgi:MFS family permease|uniref:YbfB/YjiJ family MFS transporter n=1 Tax=Limibacillus sp. MBR-115 TaxID=3156465 RepID=UPI00339A964D